jgi:hypothetical protein
MTTERVPFWRRQVYATRLSAHVVFATLMWPALTVLGTTITLMNQPYFSVADSVAFQAAVAGLAFSLPEMVLAGTIVFGISGFIFSRLGPEMHGRRFGFARLGLEPLLAFSGVVAGTAISYPALLSGPLLMPLSRLPAVAVIALLMGAVALGGLFAARSGKRLRLAIALIVLGVLSPVPMMMRAGLERFIGHPSDVVVLGLDSLSHHDDIASLKTWTNARHGTWYEYAVAPGLLTNAVWSSILTMTPVSAHHVFHTFERLTAPSTFLAAARAKGYHTVSVFPDQLTCAVGSRAGFDDDRSGPVGWRQLLLPIVANNSFLVPIVKPVFPRVWPMTSPPNLAGTFTYDVRREIRGILRAGSSGRRTLVAAHLTYTHLAAYPSSLDLSWADLRDVARAPARLLVDRSFDWQDVDRPTDPIQLQRWKLNFLQTVIRDEVESARFLESQRELVIFSDHGHRRGLSDESFRDERYFRVLLATFGRPARCPERPVSLIDIGALLGFSESRAEPVVEFAMAPPNIWPDLIKSAQFRWAGDVDLDEGLLAQVFAGLLRHKPWAGSADDRCDTTVAAR